MIAVSCLAEAASVGPRQEVSVEVIAGYRVHQRASTFPRMTDREFDELCGSIREHGILNALVIHEDEVADGIHRLRAVERLRAEGLDITIPFVEWESANGETLDEYIFNVKFFRSNWDLDQRLAVATRWLPSLEAARRARQEASRFKAGVGGPGKAASISTPPEQGGLRSSREKDESSTAGALATLAGSSNFKARQAIALFKGVSRGSIPQEEFEEVERGSKKIREVLKKAGLAKPPRRVPGPSTVHETFDDVDTVVLEGFPSELNPTDEDVERCWEFVKGRFAVTDHKFLRATLMERIRKEQREYGER